MNALEVWFHEAWVSRLGWTLLHFLWQGLAIAGALWLVRVRWGRASQANLRYGSACAALALMAAAPLITFFAMGDSGNATAAAGRAVLAAAGGGNGSPALPPQSAWEWLSPYLGAAWLAGMACATLRLAGAWLVTARLRGRKSAEAPAEWHETLARLMRNTGVERAVRLRISAAIELTAVIGWLRPVILVPAGALAGLPAAQLEALLAHELAHIRRHDYVVNLLQSAVEAVLFYHPAVWWVSRQIRLEREHCCDDAAVAATGGDVLTYARALADLEARRPAHRYALAASDGSLRDRIRRLSDPSGTVPHVMPGAGAGWALGVVLLAALGAAACGSSTLAQSQEPMVDMKTIWPDTVKQGDMKIEVRGLGTLNSGTEAEVKIAESQVSNVTAGLAAQIGFERRKETVPATVRDVRSGVTNGVVTADLNVNSPPPVGVQPGDRIDVVITVGNVSNVVYVGRPVFGRSNGAYMLFKLDPDGQHATHVRVQFGEASVNQIVVRSGLQPGDRVILSDMTAYDKFDRITLH